MFQRKAVVETKVVKKKENEDDAQKFKQYFDWAEPIAKAPSHRLLAMLRAEAEGFVKLNVDFDKEEAIEFIEKEIIKANNDTTGWPVIFC